MSDWKPAGHDGVRMCIHCINHTHRMRAMKQKATRTNIVIDDELMADAMRVTGLKTKKETVEAGLRMLLRLEQQAEIRKLRGKVRWEGNLQEMRRDK